VRLHPATLLREQGVTFERVRAMVEVACELLNTGAPTTDSTKLHRLDKADTKAGASGVQAMAAMGVSYSMLLYERFLGRPFAGHRDSVSELVGDPLEAGIERMLDEAGISFRKTRRAERVSGFEQAPDFIIPDEFDPRVVIEAKFTEDDGTARDKVTRVENLVRLSLQAQPPDRPKYEVVACIGGRGFGQRRSDMKKLILATKGKVFTLMTLGGLVSYTGLRAFRTTEDIV
jgi:hypothetical protein